MRWISCISSSHHVLSPLKGESPLTIYNHASLIAFNILKFNLAQRKSYGTFLPQDTVLFCFKESEFERLNLSLNELSTFFSVVQHTVDEAHYQLIITAAEHVCVL